MQLFNPGLDGRWATTNTLIGAIQVILPGEVARAHRHTPTAIRFIIEGTGAYTAVDGERVYMAPGDLVLTPSWSWHDHGNDGNEPVVWLDGLDIPLVQSLDSMFFQMYEVSQVPLTRNNGASIRRHGQPGLSPTWIKDRPASSPLLLYSWEHARQALEDLRGDAGDPYDGIALEYKHPMTGGPVLPTMACRIQLIRPNERLQPHRHTGSAVYYVAEGRGETMIEGQTFAWSKGDVIAQPAWAQYAHANTSPTDDAILFSISDRPVLEALHLYREE
jgi:gentisate 1,2-dioxygenase